MPKHVSFLVLFIASSVLLTADEIDFNRDIRPILSTNCFLCHGPDAADRKADLRLDTREGAFGTNNGVKAIDP
ncbi:MAG: hypothetical protein MK312_12015, partial [Roseibacillus sp.]|nr:hypothetical protein [Roseibacillus sp.]